MKANGHGITFPSSATGVALQANVGKLKIGKYTLDGIQGKVNMTGGRIDAHVNSRNAMAGGNVHINGRLAHKLLDVRLSGDISHFNLRAWGLTDKPWSVTARTDLRIKSDLDKYYYARGESAT